MNKQQQVLDVQKKIALLLDTLEKETGCRVENIMIQSTDISTLLQTTELRGVRITLQQFNRSVWET